MIVADANLLAYYIIGGELSPFAERVRQFDPHWVAPRLIQYELVNILSKHMRHRGLPRDVGIKLYRQAIDALRDSMHEVQHLHVLKLCEEHEITGFDATYLALAQKLDVELVTADSELIEKCPDHVRALRSF